MLILLLMLPLAAFFIWLNLYLLVKEVREEELAYQEARNDDHSI
jgi:hypothetical protein